MVCKAVYTMRLTEVTFVAYLAGWEQETARKKEDKKGKKP